MIILYEAEQARRQLLQREDSAVADTKVAKTSQQVLKLLIEFVISFISQNK